jgi:hypothetical protein
MLLYVIFTKYYSENLIKDGDVSGACSRHGRDEKRLENFGRKTRREETIWKI